MDWFYQNQVVLALIMDMVDLLVHTAMIEEIVAKDRMTEEIIAKDRMIEEITAKDRMREEIIAKDRTREEIMVSGRTIKVLEEEEGGEAIETPEKNILILAIVPIAIGLQEGSNLIITEEAIEVVTTEHLEVIMILHIWEEEVMQIIIAKENIKEAVTSQQSLLLN